MMTPSLIESALEQTGVLVGTILNPERGQQALIEFVNRPLATMLGSTRAQLENSPVASLKPLIADPECWTLMVAALQTGSPIHLDVPIRVAGVERWLGLRLFSPAQMDGAKHTVLTGRDITDARKSASQEDMLRRLLMSVFMHVDVPVIVVRGVGDITMANPSFHELIGYTPDELRSLSFDDLLTPDCVQPIEQARARQRTDGYRFRIRVKLLPKDGNPIHVWASSAPVKDGGRQSRVVTIEPAGHDGLLDELARKTEMAGEIRSIGLHALRTAHGPGWSRIEVTAMLRAEQFIRRRVGRDDLVCRIDDVTFAVWLSGSDKSRNEAALDKIVRELRMQLLIDFGAAPAPEPALSSS